MHTPDSIRNLAIKMAQEHGLINITRQSLCDEAGIKDGSFPAIAGCSFTDLLASIRPECPATNTRKITRGRVDPELRKEHILEVALSLCEVEGNSFNRLTRIQIGEAAGVDQSLISYYFGSMINLRRDIMRHAIKQSRLSIIAQGLAIGDIHARKAPQEMKDLAVALLATA